MMIVFYFMLILRAGRCSDLIFETSIVGVGKDVSMSCTREATGSLFWISIDSGNHPKFLRKTYGFWSNSRITATEEPGAFVLHIKRATLSDTAVYYCIKTSHKELTFLKVTNLRVEEPAITTVPPSAPVRPGDSGTQKCSVLSDSEIKTCPGVHNVCCDKAGSYQYHPRFNYSQGNGVEEQEKNPERCISSFFMNVSCSEAGSYHCVVTYEERFSDSRSKPDAEANTRNTQKDNTLLFLLCAALATSLIVIVILIYSIKELKKKPCGVCNAAVVLKTSVETASGHLQSQQADEDSLLYSAVIYSDRPGGSNTSKTEEEECIYTDVRALGLGQQS